MDDGGGLVSVHGSRQPQSITATAGARTTGLLAVIYGLGVAFLPDGLGGLKQVWLFGGAAVVGVLFLIYLVWPFVRRAIAGEGSQL